LEIKKKLFEAKSMKPHRMKRGHKGGPLTMPSMQLIQKRVQAKILRAL